MEFDEAIEEAVRKFKELDKKPVRIIGHLDSDGLAATSILAIALKREGIKFIVSIVKQLDKAVLNELAIENYNIIFFVDLGSGYLGTVQDILHDKNIFILDHHKPENVETKLVHLNPHLYGIDGATELSGAGVAYLFSKCLNEVNKDLAYLAIIGAIGDIQEYKGFSGANSEILNDAIESSKMEVKNGLRMFGMQTKPIHKVLEYSTDPYIPNVTGNEEGAIRFLREIGIEPKENGVWKKLMQLDDEDMRKLVTAIILRRLGSEEKPEDVLGPIYLLKGEKDESPMRDAKEFSTLLNACGRLKKPSLGIGICFGNKKIKEEAKNLLIKYKKEIINALDWFYENRKTEKIIEKNGYVIINAEDNIRDTLIGTLASIIAKSNFYKEGTVIMSMAHTLEEDIKISLRVAGSFNDGNLDLREIIKNITKKINADGGGHRFAAGAIIPQEKEAEFLKAAEQVLDKVVIEERVK